MFSSHNYLKRKTPCPGVDRKEFIQHLVEEFYTTNNLEAQEQVTANLANFAYDPINWNFIKDADGLKLYIELLETPNEILQQNGTAGLCNICLDEEACEFITKEENLKILQSLLQTTKNTEVLLNCCTLYYLSLSKWSKFKRSILTRETIKCLQQIKIDFKFDGRINSLCTLLLEDFAQRHEFVEKEPSFPSPDEAAVSNM